MKQPDLGRKIAFLRKEKGWTQEELVDKCNINVRTIQRIETGEVMPRPITLRLILEALDYDFEMLNKELKLDTGSDNTFVVTKLQNLLLIGFNPIQNLRLTLTILKYAWIVGLIGFLLGFPESWMEYAQYYHRFNPDLNIVYAIIKTLTLITMIIVYRGFIVIGGYHSNYLLKISVYLLIIHGLFTSLYDIFGVFLPGLQSQYADGGIAITFGIVLLIYGASLSKIKKHYGKAASIAGVLAIISGFLLITLVLWWLGLLFLIPVELLEIVILYKAFEMVKKDIDQTEI